ncbi:hypothetical protein RD110_17480 [Rhodoferax koreense]|uniref:DUF924 domain-containing protein n=1 Tax=Rhodoferax koreensis TaxID=1842727 RepID=A0A1P8JYF8_9BURK|nr:DUF924 family protein [Rhodoferax koreense]APW38775.1 hypothetical protein RD110_17480 [Rhodoferax koreense]
MPQTLETDPSPGVRQILNFWLGDAVATGWPSDPAICRRWWKSSPALDAQIAARFGPRVHQALDDGLPCWEAKPLARLALVLLLDQFTRNVFRGQARAFAGDARAQALSLDALDRGLDATLPLAGRLFLAMPLMHAEGLAMQERSVAYFQALAEQAPPAQHQAVAQSAASAREHRDIVARFGRFPHRNAVLGREDTPEEAAFLRHGPRFGQ